MGERSLTVGQKAPSFRLKNQDEQWVSLSDFAGKKHVVLYFYPKALTPGCTVQACGIRDSHKALEEVDTVVLGVSADDPDLLKKFQAKYHLDFPLLSDPDHKVSEQYGVWGEKSLFGKLVQGLKRETYIIGKDGKVKHHMAKVNTKTHHDDVLAFIQTELG